MRRVMLVLAMVLALGLLLVAGCRDKAPSSDLDRFVARISLLEGQALDDTLRHLASGGPPNAGFASYLLGNRFYVAAGEVAAARGWSDSNLVALLDSAEIHFNAAIGADSTMIEPMVNLGSLWDDRAEQTTDHAKRPEFVAKAESYYNLALKVDPTDEKARCNLGSLYLRQRKHAQAIGEFQKVLANDPRSALAHYNLAIMFAEAKIYREAIVEWELAVKSDPKGDIGGRSAENIRIVKDLINAPDPVLEK